MLMWREAQTVTKTKMKLFPSNTIKMKSGQKRETDQTFHKFDTVRLILKVIRFELFQNDPVQM